MSLQLALRECTCPKAGVSVFGLFCLTAAHDLTRATPWVLMYSTSQLSCHDWIPHGLEADFFHFLANGNCFAMPTDAAIEATIHTITCEGGQNSRGSIRHSTRPYSAETRCYTTEVLRTGFIPNWYDVIPG